MFVPRDRVQRAGFAFVVAVLVLSGCGSTRPSSDTAAPQPSQAETSAAETQPGYGAELTYVALPYGSAVTPAKVAATVAVLARRLKAAGLRASITSSGDDIVVRLPTAGSGTLPAVASSAQLYFYDWEPNVIGPRGQLAPTEASVTGGTDAGSATHGLPEYRAVLRAAKRAPELRATDTTWQPGCNPRQPDDCLYGGWYLLDSAHETMICPKGEAHCGPALTKHYLLAGARRNVGGKIRAVRIQPGTILVQARPREARNGRVINRSPNSFYVLKDNPALSGAGVTHPRQSFDEPEGGHAQPNVTFGFTPEGAKAFERATKEVAHRGQEAQLPGVAKEAAEQHFAVVLDQHLVTTPSIDYTRYPEGINAAANGSEISGGLTVQSAKKLAEEIETGTLLVRVALRTTDLGTTFG